MSPSTDKSTSKLWLMQFGIAALYVFFGVIIHHYFISHNIVSVIQPGSAPLLAALLIGGRRFIWGALLGSLLLNALSNDSLWAIFGITLANVLELMASFWLLTRNARTDLSLHTLAGYLRLIALGGVASLIGAIIGPLSLLLAGIINPIDYFGKALDWWMGNVLGITLVTPFILVWWQKSVPQATSKQQLEKVLLVGITFVAGQTVFLDWFHGSLSDTPKGYLMFLFVSWVAIRLGDRWVTLVVLMIATQGLAGAFHGVGFFAHDIARADLYNYWTYVMIISLIGMTIATYINEMKQAQASLVNSTNLLKTIIDNVPVRIFWKNKKLRYQGCNPAFARDAGEAGQADLLGKDDFQLVWKEQAELYRADDRLVMESGIAKLSFDEPQTTPDGQTIWLRTSKVPLHDAVNETIGVLGIYEDITEYRQANVEIRRLEQEYRSLVENLPDIVSRFDSELRRIYVNPALTHLTGILESSVLDKTEQGQDLPKPMANADARILQRVLSTGVPEVIETQFLGVDGMIKYYQTRLVPEFGTSGEVETILTISRDISTLKNVEAVLRESEERFYAIASNVPGMVFQCCRRADDGRLWFTYVSNGAKDLLNIDAEAILQDENEFIGRIVEEHARTFHDSLAQSQSALTLWNWEGSIAAADGSIKWINLRATPTPHGDDIYMWDGVVINITESKNNEKKLIHTQSMLRELAAHMESVREEERKHVAREIHDELGQALTALKMDVSLARLSFGNSNPQLMGRLQSMSQLVGRTIEISRHITSSLRPGALDLGVAAALEWLVEEFIGYTGIPCRLVLCDDEITLNEAASIAVFRIVQESLTNIARHAHATQAEIIVTRTGNCLCFEVRDNGKGFDPHSVASRKSFGLVGIRERMALLEGELTLDSEPGQGTRLRVCFSVVS